MRSLDPGRHGHSGENRRKSALTAQTESFGWERKWDSVNIARGQRIHWNCNGFYLCKVNIILWCSSYLNEGASIIASKISKRLLVRSALMESPELLCRAAAEVMVSSMMSLTVVHCTDTLPEILPLSSSLCNLSDALCWVWKGKWMNVC